MWRWMGPMCCVAAMAMTACTRATEDGAAVLRGRQLFDGTRPLNGGIVGHTAALPPQAIRCVNCHAAGGKGAAVAASASAFGPRLTRERLIERMARRGGPPSRYDEASLCRLLRTGADPAYVLVPRAMPRYRIDNADCHALWVHLTSAS